MQHTHCTHRAQRRQILAYNLTQAVYLRCARCIMCKHFALHAMRALRLAGNHALRLRNLLHFSK